MKTGLIMDMIAQCIEYIDEVIGICPKIELMPEGQKKKLPFFINDGYSLYSMTLLDRDFALVIPREGVEYTPAEIAKHTELVRNQLSEEVILLFAELAAYNRKRLIGHKVSFLVPGKQMYLPDLMIDLREHLVHSRSHDRECLSPSSQALLIFCILNKHYSPCPTDLIDKFSYTRMTLNRAFDELVKFKLAEKSFPGRDKFLNFPFKGKELWEKALPYFRSPINKKIFISGRVPVENELFLSGISALAKYSMIGEEEIPVYAMKRNSTQSLIKERNIKQIPSIDGANAIIEAWKYPPEILAKKEIVDPLSLYLSLKDNPDERIQGELEHMLENKIW